MFVLGLTGSIGMGKSFTANEFRRLGIPVFEADATVHRLLEPGGEGEEAVRKLFPEAVNNGKLDRKYLSNTVFSNKRLLARLESVIHPLVNRKQMQFLQEARRRGHFLVVLDIPLLLEKNYENWCDAVLLVSTSPLIQERRVLKRENMTKTKFQAIRLLQLPEMKKKSRATFTINTGLDKGLTRRRIQQLLRGIYRGNVIKKNTARNYARHGNHRPEPV